LALHHRRGIVVEDNRGVTVDERGAVRWDPIHCEIAGLYSCWIHSSAHVDNEVSRLAEYHAGTGGGYRTTRGCGCWRRRHARLRAISPAGVKVVGGITSAPDNHFTPGPDCCMRCSCFRRVGGVGACPTVRARIVSPAGVQLEGATVSTPDDHFTAGPHCSVKISDRRRVIGAGGCPTACIRIVSSSGV